MCGLTWPSAPTYSGGSFFYTGGMESACFRPYVGCQLACQSPRTLQALGDVGHTRVKIGSHSHGRACGPTSHNHKGASPYRDGWCAVGETMGGPSCPGSL